MIAGKGVMLCKRSILVLCAKTDCMHSFLDPQPDCIPQAALQSQILELMLVTAVLKNDMESVQVGEHEQDECSRRAE